MTAYPPTYNSSDAAVFQKVASLANGKVDKVPYIPGWFVVCYVANASTGVQALLLTRNLPSSGQKVAVLAVGQTWLPLLGNYYSTPQTDFQLAVLAKGLGGPSDPPDPPYPSSTPQFISAWQSQWAFLEKLIFQKLGEVGIASQVAKLPLIVVGQAIGAPLAQLGAMAFRQQRSGIPADLHTAACYTFSTPPMGNASFGSLLLATVPASFNVWADKVDSFANPPDPLSGTAPAGIRQPLKAEIPTLSFPSGKQQVDDPWREHSGDYYQSLFGVSSPGTVVPGSINAPPPGYNPNIAFTITQMIAVAYLQAQHAGLTPSPIVNGGPVSYITYLTPTGICWGAVFTDASNRTYVVFRGEICLEESIRALTQFDTSYPTYLPAGCGIAPGMNQIYSGLRTALRAEVLKQVNAGKNQVVVAGHGIGGTLANIAALDFATQGGGLPVPSAVYTFGSTPSGDMGVFQTEFNNLFASANISSFQLVRSGDPFPFLPSVPGGNGTMDAMLVLSGATPYDDNINHSLSSYITLLNPN